ncbi:transposase domain-containing protein [Sphingomonas hengshuiensis]|uniref:transposase domain-containing protein n=1 Tax=Sphingomonas hengshuiensis TaxID=1609977 RepID=UPI000A6AABED|nr:transposase domain-containing protein [Sphingomonas hengshuiensis]
MKLGGGKEWFTASELAELALPGLSTARNKINQRARDEVWALKVSATGAPLARPRMGAKGGGLEYHLSALPAAARSALVARGVGVVADVSSAPETGSAAKWRWYAAQTDKTKAEAERRMAIIALVETYESVGLTRSAAVASVAGQRGVGASTLWDWLTRIQGIPHSDRLPILAPGKACGGKEAEMDDRLWEYFKSDYLRPEAPTYADCYRRTTEYAGTIDAPMPSLKALTRRLQREIDPRVVILRRKGADALRQTLPPQTRSVRDLHALEAVNIDGHKFDVFVRWPDGRIGRPLMVAIQDLYSRMFLSWRIDESESALSTRLVFADLFRDWGIPKACVLDNGRAFASKELTGGAKSRYRFKIRDTDPTGVLVALGIAIHWALPFRGQSKPIERGFRDFCQSIAKHPAFAGAYTGNKPDAKPENYGEKAIPIEVFREVVARGIAAHNAREGRRTETANGSSFGAVFRESYATAPIGKATDEQVRLAMLSAESVRCHRKTGEIVLEGNRYWSAELSAHHGELLTIRFDPDNLHSEIQVYTQAGEFIATVPVYAPVGFFDKAGAKARAKLEADYKRKVRDMAKAEQLLDAADLAAMLPDYEDETPAPQAGVVRPVRHRGHTVAQIKPVTQRQQLAAVEQANLDIIDRLAAARTKLRSVQ